MPSRIPIRAIGRFWKKDEEGYLLNDASIDQIASHWKEPLAEIVQSYRQHLGTQLHSVYLRGSVARGLEVAGISDLDTFALVHQPAIRWKRVDWEEELQAVLQQQYPFMRTLEMMLSTYSHDFYVLNPQLAAQIKIQSVCLYGPDIAPQLPLQRLGQGLRLYDRWLKADCTDFLAGKRSTQAIMKSLLRSGFELVMERVGAYTADLYLCYRCFAQIYPGRASEMRNALHYFLNPQEPMILQRRLVKKLGSWLVKKLENELL